MKKVLTTMVGAALLVAAVPALAEDTAIKPVGLSLRLGAFLPTDRGVKDVSDAFTAFGVDYKLPWQLGAMSSDSHLSLSLDYAAKGQFRVVPVLVNYVVQRDAFYGFAGAGVTFSRRPFGGSTEDKTRFGYQVGLGWNVHQGEHPVFVEGKFIGNELSKFNGFGVFLGFRL